MGRKNSGGAGSAPPSVGGSGTSANGAGAVLSGAQSALQAGAQGGDGGGAGASAGAATGTGEGTSTSTSTDTGSVGNVGAGDGAGDGAGEGTGTSEGSGGPAPSRAGLDAALAVLPAEYTDANYVVTQMRGHFGDLFTDADEAKVRELVVAKEPPAPKVKPAAEAKVKLSDEALEFPVTVFIENDSELPLTFPEVNQFVPSKTKGKPFKVYSLEQLQRLRTDAAHLTYRHASGAVAITLE